MAKKIATTEEQYQKVIDLNRYIDRLTGETELDYKSFDITRDSEIGGASNDAWKEEVNAFADMQTLESLFFSEDWVFIVVDLIAQKISSNELRVVKQQYLNGKASYDYDDSHPLNRVIMNPNPFQDYHSWIYNLVTQYILLGNAINWYSPITKSLITLRTAQVQIEYYPSGSIKAYLYQDASEGRVTDPANTESWLKFYPQEIIHTRRPNPASLVWGMSPFVPARKALLFNRYSTDYLNNFYLKQATPGMIIETDRQVNEAQALRQLRSFEMAYTGRRNQRRTMILPKGTKAQVVSNSIADQKLVDLVNMNRETVLAILKVPPHEVGLQTAGSLGSEEYKTALRNFWEATLKPTMRMIEGSMNEFFKRDLGPLHFLRFDLTDVEALQEDQLNKADLGQKMLMAGLSINEVREKVWGEQPIDDDKASLPYVMMPPPAAPSPFGNIQLPSLPADEPMPEQAEPAEEQPETMSVTKALIQKIDARVPGWLDAYTKSVDDLINGRTFLQLLQISAEMLVSLSEAASIVIAKTLKEEKAATVPSLRELRKRLQRAFNQMEDDYVDNYEATLSQTVELGYSQQIGLVFNPQDKLKLEALQARTQNRRRLILQARGIDAFAMTSATHTERIMRQITQGVEKGETIQQIIGRVSNELGSLDQIQGKAETIARTETLTAASIGSAAAVQDAASVIPGLKKAWINANDDRVRDAHLDQSQGGVSGEVVDWDDTFSNGLRHPRDIESNDASQSINCRCTIVMLAPGEELDI